LENPSSPKIFFQKYKLWGSKPRTPTAISPPSEICNCILVKIATSILAPPPTSLTQDANEYKQNKFQLFEQMNTTVETIAKKQWQKG